MNKYLAQRTKQCTESIRESQVDALQGYRTEPGEFPQWNDEDYMKLINVDIKSQGETYKLMDDELMLVYEIEEATERIRSDATTKVQKEMGAITISGFDFTNMGFAMSLLYIILIGGIIAAVLSVLFKAVQPEPDFQKQRREKIESRKKKSQ